MVDVAGTVAGVVDALIWLVWIVVIGAVVGGVLWFLFAILPYKHFVRVRILTGDKTLIFDDKAKEVKQKDGVLKWKLKKRRDTIPIPPAAAINLTKLGKYSVEAYYTSEKEYKYIIDRGINDKEKRHFHPLTTQDREFYANEMRAAEAYKKKGLWDTISQALPYVLVFGMFVMFLVFYQDIAAPSIEMQQLTQQNMQKQAEITAHQAEITRLLTAREQGRQIVPTVAIPQNESE